MPIVADGKRLAVLRSNGRGDARRGGVPRLRHRIKENKREFPLQVFRKTEIPTVAGDVALVREHFGVNVSDALRISLHLTAQAIRENRALPSVS